MTSEELQLKRLERAIDIATMESVTPDELAQIVSAVVGHIKDLKDGLSDNLNRSNRDLLSKLSDLGYQLKDLDLKSQKVSADYRQTSLNEVKSLSDRLTEEINNIKNSIPDSFDASNLERSITDLKERVLLIKQTDPEVVEAIKARLNLVSELVNKLTGLPTRQEFNDLKRIAIANAGAVSVPATTTFWSKNGQVIGRAKNANFIEGDGVEIEVTIVDDTANITVISTGGSNSGYQQPTDGIVDGSNTSFEFATAPNVLSVDGVSMQKVQNGPDGTVNWTGTTSITLTNPPNFDLFAIA